MSTLGTLKSQRALAVRYYGAGSPQAREAADKLAAEKATVELEREVLRADGRARLRAAGHRAAADLPAISPESSRRIAEILRESLNRFVARARREARAAEVIGDGDVGGGG